MDGAEYNGPAGCRASDHCTTRLPAAHFAAMQEAQIEPQAGSGPPVALRRELRYFAMVAAFGLVVMPLLIYLAGVLTLGPYDGGLWSFLGALYRAFFTFHASAWLLLLGPYLLFWAIRLLTRPLRRHWV